MSLKVIHGQFPLAGVPVESDKVPPAVLSFLLVNTIGSETVPMAWRFPYIDTLDVLIRNMFPGAIVRVFPAVRLEFHRTNTGAESLGMVPEVIHWIENPNTS